MSDPDGVVRRRLEELLLDQELETRGVRELVLHPRNPNQGDLQAITESIKVNGFWGALVVQKSTNYVLIGNHRLMALRDLGVEKVRCFVLDVDDEEALRIMLSDNRTARLGVDSMDVLTEILVELSMSESEIGLEGTGYDGDDLDSMLADMRDLEDQIEEEARQQKPTVTVTTSGDEQAEKLAADLVKLGHPLTKVTIHCANTAGRDDLKKQLIDLGYPVATT